jgi:hypothetical protein
VSCRKWNDEPARGCVRGLAVACDSLATKKRAHNLSAQLSPGVRRESMTVMKAIDSDFVRCGQIDEGEISFGADGYAPQRSWQAESMGNIGRQQTSEQRPIGIRALHPQVEH